MKKFSKSLILALIFLIVASGIVLALSIEDYTLYTEVDPNLRLTKAANRVTWVALQRADEAYVYIDKGAGQIADNWTFMGAYTLIDSNVSQQVNIWTIANSVGTWDEMENDNDAMAIHLTLNHAPAQLGIELNETDNGTRHSSTEWETGALEDNLIFFRIARQTGAAANGKVFLTLYDDFLYTNEIWSTNIELHQDVDYRYLYCLQSADMAGAMTSAGWNYGFLFIEDYAWTGVGMPSADEVPEITTPIIYDEDTNTWEEGDNNTDTGYYERCVNDDLYAWIADNWTLITADAAVCVGSDEDEDQPSGNGDGDNGAALISLPNVPGIDSTATGYLIGVLCCVGMFLALGYYRASRWVQIGGTAGAFAFCFAMGWFEIWLIIIGAVLVGVFVWAKLGGKKSDA